MEYCQSIISNSGFSTKNRKNYEYIMTVLK